MILEENFDEESGEESRNKRSKASNEVTNHSRLLESHIKIALSLYKVQQNIYLLDFQRIEVSETVENSFVQLKALFFIRETRSVLQSCVRSLLRN
jgi:hypothetical protein